MKCGQPRGKGGEVGTRVSTDLSTIGSWKKWKGYFVAWRGRRLGGISIINGNEAMVLIVAFANERKALWNQVIRGKYEEERGG